MDAQIARGELHLCAHQREAWTDVGGVGVVRRLGLGKSVASSQVLSHGHVAPLAVSHVTAGCEAHVCTRGRPTCLDSTLVSAVPSVIKCSSVTLVRIESKESSGFPLHSPALSTPPRPLRPRTPRGRPRGAPRGLHMYYEYHVRCGDGGGWCADPCPVISCKRPYSRRRRYRTCSGSWQHRGAQRCLLRRQQFCGSRAHESTHGLWVQPCG